MLDAFAIIQNSPPKSNRLFNRLVSRVALKDEYNIT